MLLRCLLPALVVCGGWILTGNAVASAPGGAGGRPSRGPGVHKPGPQGVGGDESADPQAAARKAHKKNELDARRKTELEARARREHWLDKADKNGDGHVGPGERQQASEAFTRHLLEKADRNGDGQVDPQELAAFRELAARHRQEVEARRAALERRKGVTDSATKPGDGAGDKASGDTADASQNKPGEPAKNRPGELVRHYHWLLEHFDANGNGRLDPPELERAGQVYHRLRDEKARHDSTAAGHGTGSLKN